jgi:ribulose-phosphate 3-epimerase
MIKVSPSILSADFTNIAEAIRLLEKAGADYIHCDVMDGMFVPNITFGQYMVRDMKKLTSLPLDVHLMIDKPERYVEEFAAAGADIISVHPEATVHLDRTLQLIRSAGKKSAVALNPATPLEAIDYVLEDLDMVLLMSVNPGFGGQSLIPYVLKKASKLKSILQERKLDIDIEMDGGISALNVKQVTDAGVNVVVAGSAVFNAPDPIAAVKALKLPK